MQQQGERRLRVHLLLHPPLALVHQLLLVILPFILLIMSIIAITNVHITAHVTHAQDTDSDRFSAVQQCSGRVEKKTIQKFLKRHSKASQESEGYEG